MNQSTSVRRDDHAAETGPDRFAGDSPLGIPGWVKVSGLVLVAIVVAFVALVIVGGHHPSMGPH